MKTAKPHKAYQKVNTRKRSWIINEGGDKVISHDVTLWLDPRGEPTFVFALPEYVFLALGERKWPAGPYGEQTVTFKGGELRGADAEDLTRILDKLCDEYVTHVRTATAVPVILLQARYAGRDQEGNLLRDDRRHSYTSSRAQGEDGGALVELGYTLAFRVGKHLHSRKAKPKGGGVIAFGKPRDDEVDYVPGGHLGYVGGDPIELPYTQELHTEIDRIIAVLSRAAEAIATLKQSKNPLAAITGLAARMLPAPAPFTEAELEEASEAAAIGVRP